MSKVYGILTGDEMPSRGIDTEMQRSESLIVVADDAEFEKSKKEATT